MRFGGLIAVNDLRFAAQRRDITAIIGPNGAGKTTVFNCLTGFYKPTVRRLTLSPPGASADCWQHGQATASPRRRGVARTFQNIRLFSGMTRARKSAGGAT